MQNNIVAQQGAAALPIVEFADPSRNIYQIDFLITSSLTTALVIEMFNSETSQFVTVNAGINTYKPLAGVLVNGPTIVGSTANSKALGVIFGAVDFYVNANAATPAAGTLTQDICYFDLNGTAVYQPGYNAAGAVAGTLTIASTTTGVSYRSFMEWTKRAVWDWHSAKMDFSEVGQQANDFEITEKLFNGPTNRDPVKVKTTRSNGQYDKLLLLVPVLRRMRCNKGVRYNVNASTLGGGVPQTVGISMFVQPILGKGAK